MTKKQTKGGGSADYRKGLDELVTVARSTPGWRVEATSDGWAFKPPIVQAHMTASDVRALANLKAQLRRLGLPV